MPLPPGPVYLANCLPSLLVPLFSVYGLDRLLTNHLQIHLPLWAVAVSTIASIPLGLLLKVYYNDFINHRKAHALGAVLPPRVHDKYPAGFGLLLQSLGNFKDGYPGDFLTEMDGKYGNTFNIKILFEDRIFTIEPEYMKAILATQFDAFEKGTGVFNSDGEMWKFHRAMTRPFFSKDRITHFDIFERHAQDAIQQLKVRLGEGFPVDIQDLASRFTMDSATDFLFGKDVRSLEAGLPYPHYSSLSRSASVDTHPANIFSKSFDQAQRILALRSRFGAAWPLTEFWQDKVEKKMGPIFDFINPILSTAVARNKATGNGEKLTANADREVQDGECLLDHLIKYTDDPIVLRDETLNILLAGRDTTTNTISYAIYSLAKHPDVLNRLRNEILSKLGNSNRPTYDDMKDMKYLRAVINETLRLYPAVVFLMHRRTDLWGPDGVFKPSYTDATCSFNPYGAANEFDPDRFLDERLAKYLTPNPFIFLPFNAGPRICLGQQISLAPEAQPAESLPPSHWATASGTKGTDTIRIKTYLTMSIVTIAFDASAEQATTTLLTPPTYNSSKMPLEATMMLIDNSEYMRNGDYAPSRWEAQKDAVTTVFQTKIDANPENTVGIMTMAGKGPEVLVTHSKDLGQILQALHTSSSKIGGTIDIPTAIAVAQLALKHRENKNLRQRIIVFVASPLEGQAADDKAMVKLAKKLKKNNVAVDIVSYGDGIEETSEEDKGVLRSFVDSASSSDNSHLVSIPPGTRLLSDALISSPILSADRSASIPAEFGGTGGDVGAASGSGAANQFEFGVDPSLDPELALALQMSMQEAQAREAAEAATSASNQPEATPTPAPPAATTSVPAEPTDDEEERLLQQALAMSQEEHDVEMEDEDEFDEDEDEEAAIARAIEMREISSISFLNKTIIVLNSHRVANEMLHKKSLIYSDRPVQQMVGNLVGWKFMVPLLPFGDRFRRSRRLLHGMIGSPASAKYYGPVEAQEMHKLLRRVLVDPDNLGSHVHHTVGSIMLRLSYGYNVEEHNDPLVKLVDAVMNQFALASRPGAYPVNAFPSLRRLPTWFPGAGFKKTAKEWAENLIKMVEQPYNSVKSQMVSYVSCGFMICCIAALNPEVARKAQAEIDSVVGEDRLPTLEDRSSLPYVDAVVKEVLRWNVVAPIGVPHRSTEDDEHDGYFIPKGSIIFVNLRGLLHDPAVYLNPEEFNPERFIASEGKPAETDPKNVCFGYGRRAMALSVFDITKYVENGMVIEPVYEITTGTLCHPKPYKCSIKPRSEKAVALIQAESSY
ncbi:hypothetical protein H0H93_002108 [Arthromyces matolae]|nr:hypothetical protein H0H93_002108 [Arthromyces matolae]